MKTIPVIDKSLPAGPDGAALGKVLQLIYGQFVGQAVCLAARLRIADRIAEGRAHTDELASVLKARPESLRRFLRSLASHGLIIENAEDRWALTETGDC